MVNASRNMKDSIYLKSVYLNICQLLSEFCWIRLKSVIFTAWDVSNNVAIGNFSSGTQIILWNTRRL
jgi:hypothetical protein